MKNETFDVEFIQAEKNLDRGYFDQAARGFREIIKEFPGEAKCYSKLGVCFACQKKFNEAREYMEKAIELDAEFPEPYNNLGNIFLEEKKYDKAVAFYKKAISLNSNYAAPYSNLGLAYKKLNKYNKAVDSFKRAAEIERKIPTVKTREIITQSKLKINLNWIILIIIGLLITWLLVAR